MLLTMDARRLEPADGADRSTVRLRCFVAILGGSAFSRWRSLSRLRLSWSNEPGSVFFVVISGEWFDSQSRLASAQAKLEAAFDTLEVYRERVLEAEDALLAILEIRSERRDRRPVFSSLLRVIPRNNQRPATP